jgi:hypothetical protein
MFSSYPPHLLEHPKEATLLPTDANSYFFVVILDKAYVDPLTYTPDFHCICPAKNAQSEVAIAQNKKISCTCVPVEQFFRQVLALWGIAANVYQWDHNHFNIDFENCYILTNK